MSKTAGEVMYEEVTGGPLQAGRMPWEQLPDEEKKRFEDSAQRVAGAAAVTDPAMRDRGQMCYAVFEGQKGPGGYIPSVVYENESGHYPLSGNPADFQEPWYWGEDFETAESVCAKANLGLGLSEAEVEAIKASSIRLSIRASAAKERFRDLTRD